MHCERGRQLREEYQRAHHEVQIAHKEVGSEPPTHHQSEGRLLKAQEVEHGAENLFERHCQSCEACAAETSR